MKKHNCLMLLLWLLPLTANAEIILCRSPKVESTGAAQETTEQGTNNPQWQRVAHEPNSFGYTADGGDKNYIDINLSLKWSPMDDALSIPEARARGVDKYRSCNGSGLPYIYLAFTTRQAFYLSTRRSSPVIGQRYNPEIIGRYWLEDGGYLDFGYNHESNGQSIDSFEAYQTLENELIASGDSSSLGKEYISRGWDFWELTWKTVYRHDIAWVDQAAYFFTARYFVSNGLFQGKPEEVNDWEKEYQNLSRSQVDGLRFLGRWDLHDCRGMDWVCLQKISYQFTTGYEDPLENNAHRLEMGVKFFNAFPFTLWFSSGYNDDLVDYYRRVKSVGVSLELGSFLTAILQHIRSASIFTENIPATAQRVVYTLLAGRRRSAMIFLRSANTGN